MGRIILSINGQTNKPQLAEYKAFVPVRIPPCPKKAVSTKNFTASKSGILKQTKADRNRGNISVRAVVSLLLQCHILQSFIGDCKSLSLSLVVLHEIKGQEALDTFCWSANCSEVEQKDQCQKSISWEVLLYHTTLLEFMFGPMRHEAIASQFLKKA